MYSDPIWTDVPLVSKFHFINNELRLYSDNMFLNSKHETKS